MPEASALHHQTQRDDLEVSLSACICIPRRRSGLQGVCRCAPSSSAVGHRGSPDVLLMSLWALAFPHARSLCFEPQARRTAIPTRTAEKGSSSRSRCAAGNMSGCWRDDVGVLSPQQGILSGASVLAREAIRQAPCPLGVAFVAPVFLVLCEASPCWQSFARWFSCPAHAVVGRGMCLHRPHEPQTDSHDRQRRLSPDSVCIVLLNRASDSLDTSELWGFASRLHVVVSLVLHALQLVSRPRLWPRYVGEQSRPCACSRGRRPMARSPLSRLRSL